MNTWLVMLLMTWASWAHTLRDDCPQCVLLVLGLCYCPIHLSTTSTGTSVLHPLLIACGRVKHWTRIIGGSATEVNEYPWMVALANNAQFFCGGTLINDLYVLTAAHCLMNMKRNSLMRVVLSEHNQAYVNETMVELHSVHRVLRHPGFRPAVNLDNDLALIRLKNRVTFKTSVMPACLPPPDEEFADQVGVVAGWGAVSENGSSSSVLQAVHVPILTHAQCQMTDYEMTRLTGNMLCAGDVQGGADSCQGDSGGALLVQDNMMRLVAAGVVSWGEGCARPRLPGIYTRVNRYLPWILSNTMDACYCG